MQFFLFLLTCYGPSELAILVRINVKMHHSQPEN